MGELLDYTIFHIGVYISLSAVIVAADVFWNRKSVLMPLAVLLLLLAGAAGGVVAGNIPANSATSHSEFLSKPAVILYDCQIPLSYWWIIAIEHTAFWIAIAILLAKFLIWRYQANTKGKDRHQNRQVVATSFGQLIGDIETRMEKRTNDRVQEFDSATKLLQTNIEQLTRQISALEQRLDG